MAHLELHGILCHQQHGFRRKRSCETQLLKFADELVNNMAKGKQTGILVMDFAKAFDKVNHSLLVYKLHHYGIQEKLLTWISDFLKDRRQAVVVNGIRSDFIRVQSGVPQGSVLGPCLFLVYINDVPDLLTAHARLFTDDTAVYDVVESPEDQDRLQQNLDQLAEWEKRWDMVFHPEKCSTLPATRRRKDLPQPQYQLRGHILQTVNSVNCLELCFTKDLSWNEHINNVCSKATKTLGFLRRNLKISSRGIKETAYKTLVLPIMEYAAAVWDPLTQANIDSMEAIQRRVAHFVLRRYRNTSSVSNMIDELRWPSLQDRRRTARLTMLYKIRHELVCMNNMTEKLQPAVARQRRGHIYQYVQPRCRTQYQQQSFLPRTIQDWNNLPLNTGQCGCHNHRHFRAKGLQTDYIGFLFVCLFLFLFCFVLFCLFVVLLLLLLFFLFFFLFCWFFFCAQCRPPFQKRQNNQLVDCRRFNGRRRRRGDFIMF